MPSQKLYDTPLFRSAAWFTNGKQQNGLLRQLSASVLLAHLVEVVLLTAALALGISRVIHDCRATANSPHQS